MPALLELKGISKVYGNGVYANRRIDFSVDEGEIHALVGENGAGKSTLMKVIYGMEQPDQGEIYIHGQCVRFHSPQDAMHQNIGMVHQHFMLVESLSIAQNVTLGFEPARLGFIDRKQTKAKVREIAKVFDLHMDLDTKVSDLSVGVKQKVEIIKAMYRGAKLLILDEPTAVLTPQETVELFARLKRLKASGYTVIFISHKLREIMDLCDRCSVMKKGEMVDTVHIAEVTQQQISEMMVGKGYTEKLDKAPAGIGDVRIRVKDVAYIDKFGKRAVDGVSFTVRAGEIVGVAGVEGNGQGELTKMLFRLMKPAGGSIEVMGREIKTLSIHALRRLGVAYVPADRMALGLANTMSIEDNLMSCKLDDRRFYKAGLLSQGRIRQMSERLVKQFQVKCTSPSTPIQMLSGGNMQKVVVAREFTQDAQVIIVEQPTRGIDVGAARFVHERLLELSRAGAAILLVSADLDELFKLADSVLVMYGGRIDAYFREISAVNEQELGYYMMGVKQQSAEEIGCAYHE